MIRVRFISVEDEPENLSMRGDAKRPPTYPNFRNFSTRLKHTQMIQGCFKRDLYAHRVEIWYETRI